MSTDKTTRGDFKILLIIILCSTLVWGFFKYKNKVFLPTATSTQSTVAK
ncbi:MAG: hypothetical protein WAV41_00180 [Microgenomates group bacterium]